MIYPYQNSLKSLMFGLCLCTWVACKPKVNNPKPSETCLTCLADMVYHSNLRLTGPNASFAVRVDEESSDLVKMKVYNQNNGQTLGWIAYYPKQRKLAEVSSYLRPKPLQVPMIWLEKYESCRGLLCGDEPKTNTRMAVNTNP